MENKYMLDLFKEVDINIGLTDAQDYVIIYKDDRVLFLDTQNENLNSFSFKGYTEYLLESQFSTDNLNDIINFYANQKELDNHLEQFYSMKRDLKNSLENL